MPHAVLAFNLPPDRLAFGRLELARALGLSPQSFDRLITRGKFPKPNRYAGRRPLWAKSTVEEWLRGEPSARPGVRLNRQPRVI